MEKILTLCPVQTNKYRVGILYLKRCKMSCLHRTERMRLHPSKLLISRADVFLQNVWPTFKVCGFPLVEIFCLLH